MQDMYKRYPIHQSRKCDRIDGRMKKNVDPAKQNGFESWVQYQLFLTDR